jgi:predicted MFS family arabinose efflux permease
VRVPGLQEEHRAGARMMLGASGLTTLGALPPFLLGAQAVWVRADLGIGLAALGAGVSVFFGSAAVGAVTAGLLFDRIGRRNGLLVAAALVVAGGLAMATVVEGPASLLVCMAALGLGNAACQTTANLAMARALPPDRRGLGFGVKQSAVPLAIMLGGLAVPTLGGLLGWRSTFVATAAAGALAGLWSLVRPPLEVRASEAPDRDPDRPPWGPLLLCGLAITLASASANSLGSFLASWGYEVGLTATAAGLLMAVGSGASIVVRVFSGHRADGRRGGNLRVVAAQMVVGAVAFVGLAVGTPVAVVLSGFLAFAIGWSWPGLLLYAVARIGRDAPARASGVVQAGAFVGGALGPVGFGALAAAAGFPVAWLASSGLFLLAATLVVLGRRGFAADLEARPPRSPVGWGGARIPH